MDDDLGARIDGAIEGTASYVAAYFDPAGPFAGSLFDHWGDNPADRITSDDLLATTLLNISFRPRAIRALLIDDVAPVGALLASIPVDVELWEAEDGHLAAAEATWDYLRTLDGIDWVTAGKLLARKRPHLVPVLDSVVEGALQPPNGQFWRTLRAALQSSVRRTALETLRPTTAPDVSLLRLLDVAVWMRFSQGGNALNARGESRS